MRKERKIVLNIIKVNKINNNKLADFFAKKYSDKVSKGE